MSSFEIANATAFLKQRFSPRFMREILYESPLIGLLGKQQIKTGGDVFKQPVIFGEGGSPSGSLLEAIAGQSGVRGVAFLATTVDRFDERVIENKLIEASRTDVDAFARQLDMFAQNAMRTISRQVAVGLYGTQRGVVATVASVSSGPPPTITLSETDMVGAFGVGNRIVVTVGATSALRSGTATVTAVNRDTGVLTVDALPTGAAAADQIAFAGNFLQGHAGLGEWLPAAAPTPGSSLFGVDRSVDSRLIGARLAAAGMTIATALRQLSVRLARDFASPSVAVLSPSAWAQLTEELAGQIVYDKMQAKDEASISFDAVVVPGYRSKIKAILDPYCPPNRIYMLTPETWSLVYVGEDVVSWFEQGGSRLTLAETTPGWKFRLYSYVNLVCAQPYANGVALLDQSTLT